MSLDRSILHVLHIICYKVDSMVLCNMHVVIRVVLTVDLNDEVTHLRLI